MYPPPYMTCMHPPPYGTDTVVLRLHRRFPIGQIEQIKSWTPQQVGGGKKKNEKGKKRTISCTTLSLSMFYFIYQSIYLFCYLLKVQAECVSHYRFFIYLSLCAFIYLFILLFLCLRCKLTRLALFFLHLSFFCLFIHFII